jgi:signal transduction histidine kinase
MATQATESTVLIVDDTVEHRELMSILLRQSGFNVLTAQNTEDAYKLVVRVHPDLVLSDVVMPGGSGVELCRLIRKNVDLNRIPILLVSGLDKDTAHIVEALASGADDYIEMPFEPHRLVAKVVRLLERRKAEENLERQVQERTEELTALNLKLKAEIEDRAHAEEALRRTEEWLMHSQKLEAIGSLAGGVAHDFNNLLTAILGNTQLLLGKFGEDNPHRNKMLEIEKAGKRAAALTRQLLAFSRRQLLERCTVRLNETVGSTIKMLERIIGEDIQVSKILAADLWTVYADAAQIDQVLMNLGVNARDAMPNGGRLLISTKNVVLDESYSIQYPYAQPGKYVQLEVSDTGCGMDAKTRQRIFEPFFTTKEIGKGTGLGLSMAYGIIKQHYGHINVYSEPGHGTTFRVYLPATEMAVDEEAIRAAPHYSGGTETILVAEDEEALRWLVKDILESLGYEVLLADDGKSAVEVFVKNRERIDVLLMDLVMPRMSGLEAYEQIQRLRPNLPLVIMTGYSSDSVHCFERFDGLVLQKPYNIESLGGIIREALDIRKKGEI